MWLDAFDEATRTNFELDGAKYHGSPAARERDLRRDAASVQRFRRAAGDQRKAA